MLTTSGLAETAALIGDPARANMLLALMDGRMLTATELAGAGGITPQTASTHLARMTQAGLLTVERQGRHRFHRLSSITIAQMLEGIMAVATKSPGSPSLRPRTGPRDLALRRARTCYDHLAGQVTVTMADRMVEREQLELSADGGLLTENGAMFLSGIGVDLNGAAARSTSRRLFCRPCLDWSERRPHIAGTVGAALLATCLSRNWMLRTDSSRAVTVPPAGRQILDRAFDFDTEFWAGTHA